MLYEVVTMYRYKPEDGSLLFKYIASVSRLNTTKVYDLSQKRNHATIFTSLTLKQSLRNSTVFNFNGLNNFLSHPKIHFNNYEEHTYSAWLKWSGPLPSSFVIPFGDYLTASDSIYLAGSGGFPQFQYRPHSGSKFAIPNTNLTLLYGGKWHMITWSVAKTRHLRIYIDGRKIAEPYYIENTEMYYTGIGSGCTGYIWNGQMNEIRLYNRKLSSSDIKDLYNKTKGSYGK